MQHQARPANQCSAIGDCPRFQVLPSATRCPCDDDVDNSDNAKDNDNDDDDIVTTKPFKN